MTYNEMIPYLEHSDYDINFWNAMRGKTENYDLMNKGLVTSNGTYAMAPRSNDKCQNAINAESLFRQICTVIKAYGSGYRIFAKDCDDLAVWVPEGNDIPIYDSINDFTQKPVDSHKLTVFVKTDEDFIYDAAFDMENYLIRRLGKNFGRAEDDAFINGTGLNMPTGILAEENGADVGVTDAKLTYEDVVKLYFSVKPEYRRKGVWLMNDETALTLRTLKDSGGNYIWNHANDTIFGQKVLISEFMPNADAGAKPIAFGDFSYYWLVLRRPVSVRTIQEKFVLTDQIGHLAVEFLDGKLIRSEAVKVMQMTE
jgi:HK97 family phage major capsid protein